VGVMLCFVSFTHRNNRFCEVNALKGQLAFFGIRVYKKKLSVCVFSFER